MPKPFPSGTRLNMPIPADPNDPSGMSAVHVQVPGGQIPFNTQIAVDDPNRFLPLAAVDLTAEPRSIPAACVPRIPFYRNDSASRCAIWLAQIRNLGASQSPPQIEFQVRQSDGFVSEVRFHGLIKASSFYQTDPGGSGLLVQIAGLLSTRFEVWAYIPSNQGGVSAAGVELTLEFILDRQGVGDSAIVGSMVTALPV